MLHCVPACSDVQQFSSPRYLPHAFLLYALLLHAAVRKDAVLLRDFIAAQRDRVQRDALLIVDAMKAEGSAGSGDVLCAAQLLRGSRCCEPPRRLAAAAAPRARARFGAVPLRPIKPVGSSENGLSVAAAACQA